MFLLMINHIFKSDLTLFGPQELQKPHLGLSLLDPDPGSTPEVSISTCFSPQDTMTMGLCKGVKSNVVQLTCTILESGTP